MTPHTITKDFLNIMDRSSDREFESSHIESDVSVVWMASVKYVGQVLYTYRSYRKKERKM